jgi:hypothetical protein
LALGSTGLDCWRADLLSRLANGSALQPALVCLTLFLVVPLAALSGCASRSTDVQAQTKSANVLLLGNEAIARSPIDIPIQLPAPLNFKTRAQVLQLRQGYVEATANLVSGPYLPSAEVFARIEDNKPWWGIIGQGVWGPGPRASEGVAEESRFILNPYLLAGANPAVEDMWLPEKMTGEDLARPDFPFCWEPSAVRLDAVQRFEEVVYDVSKFNQQMNLSRAKLRKQTIFPDFGIIAYNARDFNFNYIYWDPKQSVNVENIDQVAPEAVPIVQMIHCGGTCKIPGGCNNMSPAMKSIDRIKYKALPARTCVLLWHDKPQSVQVKPDMVVYIDLK